MYVRVAGGGDWEGSRALWVVNRIRVFDLQNKIVYLTTSS